MKVTWFKALSLATTAMLVTSTNVEAAKKKTSAPSAKPVAQPVVVTTPAPAPVVVVPETKPSGVLVAEASNVATDAGTTTAKVPSTDSAQKYILGIDIRPSYYPTNYNATPGQNGGDKFGIEYTLTAGIQFSKDTSFVYDQYINTQGDTPNAQLNLQPKVMEGAARVLVNNLWTSDKLGLSLSYENRTLLPWRKDLREANRVLANRNYIKLKKTFSENFNLSLMEVPIAYVHTTPNFISGGKVVNNKAFENRLYLVPAGTMMDGKLSLSMPIYLSSLTRREESTFLHELIAQPEVTYAVSENIAVGVAWMSGSFVKPKIDGFQIGQGFTDGETQLVFRASL